jgi:hypothetical protein
MEFKRQEIEIILAGTGYRLIGLVPADFLSEECWPFRYYHLKDEEDRDENAWNWKGGIKPKWLLEAEARIRKVLALGVVTPKLAANDLVSLCQDEKLVALRNLLFGVIFSLSYGIIDAEKYKTESVLDRNHLIEIGIKARELGREPWEIMFGMDGLPEGFNPRRHDFNTLTLRVMFERDSELSRRHPNG